MTNNRRKRGHNAAKTDIYQTVTDAIIAAIESGQTAEKFVMPWDGFTSLPLNASTGKSYRGINIPMLWVHQMERRCCSGYWATYKQWQELGAQVRKGEKGAGIVFWKLLDVEPEEDNDEGETRMFARWSTVFNADQVDGFTIPASENQGNARIIETAEDFMAATGARITHGGTRAYYQRGTDTIALPEQSSFHDTPTSTATEAYYSTALHELTHWTGAPKRLDRKKGKRFGDADYAFEELIAELGAAMLCATLGITSSTRPDHAHYIDGWLKALKNDKRFIFSAASQAQKAADYLLSLQPEV
ncbi:MAG: zincin-like metallopeptidase domain-containing protein [Bacteroidota bacterium]